MGYGTYTALALPAAAATTIGLYLLFTGMSLSCGIGFLLLALECQAKVVQAREKHLMLEPFLKK